MTLFYIPSSFLSFRALVDNGFSDSSLVHSSNRLVVLLILFNILSEYRFFRCRRTSKFVLLNSLSSPSWLVCPPWTSKCSPTSFFSSLYSFIFFLWFVLDELVIRCIFLPVLSAKVNDLWRTSYDPISPCMRWSCSSERHTICAYIISRCTWLVVLITWIILVFLLCADTGSS